MTDYVVVKMVTGETVLASVIMEFEDAIVLAFPILLKSIPTMKDGMMLERLATAEFCPFTDEKEFQLYRKDVVYMKPMKQSVAIMYQRTLQDFYIMPSEETETNIEVVSGQQEKQDELEDQESSKPTYH